jgi:predicted dehydrogenase
MTSTSRRDFVRLSLAAAALGPVHTWADDKPRTLRLALIGCGGIMTNHIKGLVSRADSVEIAWLCDVDPSQIDRLATLIPTSFQATPPARTGRFEDVLNDRTVDACIIATPHHWHTPIALAAMEAGKDVYIEKPISHVYHEGELIIAAAKKYGRIVQQGTQMRSSPVTLKAEKLLKDGLLGDIKVAKAWTAETRSIVRPLPDGVAPAGVDYDRWLGPAPARPFNPHRFHGTWRMFKDYGNGEIGDDGIHDLDMAAWGLGISIPPKQITARGGRMLLDGHASEYPDNMNVTYEYPDGRLLVYENYPFTAYGIHGFDNGNVFYGTTGYMIFSRRGAFSTFLGPKGTPGPTEGKEIRGQNGYAEHMRDFLNSVHTRKPTRANPEIAHASCALVHFGEIALATSGRIDFDAASNRFTGNDEATGLLTKTYRPLYNLPS